MARPGRWRRALKKTLRGLLYTVLALLVLLVATILLLRRPAGLDLLRRQVLKQTRDLVPGLALERIEGDLTSTLTLHGVVLNDRFGGPAIRVRRIGLRYTLTRLARGTIKVDLLELDEPELQVRPSRNGQLNLSQLVIPSPEEKPPSEPTSLRLDLSRLLLRRGRVVVAGGEAGPLIVEGLEVDLGLEGGIRDARLELRRLQARVQLPDRTRLEGSLSGRAAIDPERVETHLAAQTRGLLPSTELALTLDASGPHSRVQLGIGLAAPGKGKLTVEGWAGVDEKWRPRWALRARASELVPDELVPALRPTALGLELETDGDGVPLQAGSSARVALRVPPSTVRGLRLDGITLRARTRDAGWVLEELGVEAANGTITVSGQGTLDRVQATANVDLPRLDRMPVAVRQLGVPRLGGSVKLSARVSGPLKGPLSVRAAVGLRSIAMASLSLKRGELSARIDGLPAAPAGELGVVIERLDPGDARLRVDRARLQVSGDPRRLRIFTEASGPSLRAKLLADAAISAGARRVDAWLRQLELQGLGHSLVLRNESRLSYQPTRIELGPTRVALLGGEVTASGVFQPRGFPRLVASLKVDGIRPPGFPHPVSAALDARLERGVAQVSLLGELRSFGTRLQLAARVPIRYRGARPVPELRREGELELRATGLKLALLRELRPDLPAASGELGLAVKLKGPLQDPDLQLDVQLTGVAAFEIRGVEARTQLTVAQGRSTIRHRSSLAGRALLSVDGTVPVGLGRFLKGGAPSWEAHRSLPLDLHLAVPSTDLATLPRVHEMLQRIGGNLSARVDLKGTLARPALQLRTRLAGAILDGKKLGDLELQARAAAGDSDLRLQLLAKRDGVVLVDARGSAGLELEPLLGSRARALPPAIPLDLTVELPGYGLDRLASLDQALEGLRGKLSGKVRLTGHTRAPRARAEVRLAGLGFAKVNVGELRVTGSYEPARVEAGLELRQPEGGQLRGGLQLPLPGGDGLQAFLHGRRLDLSFLSSLSTAVQESAGKLDLDVKATGSLATPVLAGRIALDHGKLHLRGVSPLHQLQARLELEPDRLRLSRLVARGERGQIDASGLLQLTGRGLELSRGPGLLRRAELTARAKGFGVDAGGVSGVVFSGTVKVDAQTEGRTLVVKVSVDDGAVRMPKIKGKQTHATSLPPDLVFVKRSRPAARTARAAAGQAPLGLRLNLDADPLFVRGEQMDLELANHLFVRTDRKGRPRVSGHVQIRRGRIWVLKNTFEVRRAMVRLSGELDPDPALDILLERAAPEAAVLVQVSGTARKPELSLRSDPPIYDQSQILSLLLTGRVDSRPDSGGGDPSMALASAISQVLLGSILQTVAPRIGLDVARVSFDESKDKKTGESQLRAEAEVGRYLTERLYIGYRRVFGASAQENTNEGLMEYRISARWLLMALFGDAGVGGLDLLWNLRH